MHIPLQRKEDNLIAKEEEWTPQICLFHNRFECFNYKIALDIGFGLLVICSFNSKFDKTTDIIKVGFKEKLKHINMATTESHILKVKKVGDTVVVNKQSLKKNWYRLKKLCCQFEKFCKASIFTIFSIRDLSFIPDKDIDFSTDIKMCNCHDVCACDKLSDGRKLRFNHVHFKIVLLKCNNIIATE